MKFNIGIRASFCAPCALVFFEKKNREETNLKKKIRPFLCLVFGANLVWMERSFQCNFFFFCNFWSYG